MDALLSLEPRVAGDDIAEPNITFAEHEDDPDRVCTPYTYGTRICSSGSKVC